MDRGLMRLKYKVTFIFYSQGNDMHISMPNMLNYYALENNELSIFYISKCHIVYDFLFFIYVYKFLLND
jgi:hypothetical protein